MGAMKGERDARGKPWGGGPGFPSCVGGGRGYMRSSALPGSLVVVVVSSRRSTLERSSTAVAPRYGIFGIERLR